ncbi:MAG: FkbM family methyltransferase [Cyclobacteriaceae bacterium]|nr:FkbM family methyltransferase [Cyclobacteriaceae bacterium]
MKSTPDDLYGQYQFRGMKKKLFKLAQKLPKSSLGFKTSLILRKLALQNRVKIVDETQFGLKLRLYPLDNLGDRFLLFLPKFFEYEEFLLMSTYLKPDSTFIDIGGNMGIYSLMAAKYISEKGRILSFEPNPTMIRRFEYNIELNNFSRLIELHKIGIADKNSTFNLGLTNKNLGGSSIVQDYGEGNISIKCRPLLDVLKEQNITKIDLLKIDIEKAEPLALNPFFENSPRELYPKMIIIESDEGIDLKKLGYKFIAKHRTHNSIYTLEEA